MKITRDLIIDAVLLAVYAIAANPAATGLLIHEWVSIGALLVALVHTVLHWDWTVETLRRFLGKLAVAPRWNLVIDVVAFVAFIAVMISGFGVSRHVLLVFGYFAPGYFVWKPVHSISAVALLALVIVHLAMHWKWIATAVRTRIVEPLGARRGAAAGAAAPDQPCTDSPERVS